MNKNTLENMTVLATLSGDHFHFFTDCRALAQGQRNSVKFGRELSPIDDSLTVSDAIDDGKWGCRVCFAKAGLDLPLEADRKAARASRKAARALAAEAKAKDANKVANKAVRTATKSNDIEAARAANVALEVADLARKRAALLMSIAAVYRFSGTDKVRWDAATLRHIPSVAALKA
jgi:regulator of protease activity HflC (stomatin/prohibitin superfamily)